MDSLATTLSSFADRATGLARRIGPKRGITALAVLSAAVAASVLVRRLRRRAARRRDQRISQYAGTPMEANVPQAGLEQEIPF